MVSFGDSLSDTGNVHQSTGQFGPPYAGVASNGPLWLEYLSQELGLGNHTASLLGGTAQAWAGAKAGTGEMIPSILNQVFTYLQNNPDPVDNHTLYTIWGGANDLLNLSTTNMSEVTAAAVAAASAIAISAQRLTQEGATSVLILNMPNLGLTPLMNGNSANVNVGSSISQLFNNLLNTSVQSIPGDIVIFDTFTWMNSIIQDLDASVNKVDACFVNLTLCQHPEEYIWFDLIHPTTYAFKMLASEVVDSIQTLEVYDLS